MPPDFDRLESFSHDELTAKHCYFRCSRIKPTARILGTRLMVPRKASVHSLNSNYSFCVFIYIGR